MNSLNPDVLPFIGIAPSREILVATDTKVRIPADDNGPSRVVKAGSPTGKTFAGPSLLVGANGRLISASPEPAVLFSVTGDTLNSLTWDDYLAWRKSKCRPYDYTNGPAMATIGFDPSIPAEAPRERALEEIDQAIHEFVGEVAELGELFIENGPLSFFGSLRDKIIDECGDIFFCGAWALDAWGENPFAGADDLEMIRVTDESELAMFAGVIASREPGEILGNQKFVSILGGMIFNLMMTAQTNAGLLCNSYKKLRFQRRQQDVKVQVSRIANVLVAVNQILIIANSSVEEALKVNQRKLDARFPEGYKPGVGGGIRTGEGA